MEVEAQSRSTGRKTKPIKNSKKKQLRKKHPGVSRSHSGTDVTAEPTATLGFRTVPTRAQVTLHVLRYGWMTLRGLGLHQYYILVASVTTQFASLCCKIDNQYERTGTDYGHWVHCCSPSLWLSRNNGCMP